MTDFVTQLYRVCAEYNHNHPKPPTALFVYSDDLSAYLRKQGYQHLDYKYGPEGMSVRFLGIPVYSVLERDFAGTVVAA